MTKIRVRFAPSPTGNPHIGSIRTALYDYLFAKNQGGDFILRIEDTDRNRLVEDSVKNIKDSLAWLGLKFDEGPFYQSERLDIYQKYIQELLDKKWAYRCFCSLERLEEMRQNQATKHEPPRYDRRCLNLTEEEIEVKIQKGEKSVVRFKMPEDQKVVFDDVVYGRIEFNSDDLDDQIILKSDGFPTYHLAVVVDDYLMKISHVIRGQEWISSTPKHILLYRAFDWPIPKYIHLPVIVGPDKAKLSKRHGARGALDYQALGYLPEAIVNFLVLLGWAPGDDREIMTIDEMITLFSLDKINKASPVFDQVKLDHFNGLYIRKLSIDELADRLLNWAPADNHLKKWANQDRDYFEKALKTIQERMVTLADAEKMLEFYFEEPEYEVNLLKGKRDIGDKGVRWEEEVKMVLEASLSSLSSLSSWSLENLEQTLRGLIANRQLPAGLVLWPIRVALTGLDKSPGVFEVLEVLGREKSLARIQKAIGLL